MPSLRNDLPTIKQLNDGGKYFPYRYGEALWAYIGGTWGDETVPRLFRASLSAGFDDAIRRVLGMTSDSLSTRWRTAIRAAVRAARRGRARVRRRRATVWCSAPARRRVQRRAGGESRRPAGRVLLVARPHGHRSLPRGRRDGQGAGQARGAERRLALRRAELPLFGGHWSPDAKRLAFVTYADGDNEIDILDVRSRKITRRIKPKDIGAITTVAWSPDGDAARVLRE